MSRGSQVFLLHLLGPPRHGVLLEFVVGVYAAWQRRQRRQLYAARRRQQLELLDVDLQRGLARRRWCVDRSRWFDSVAVN